jgi:hypothetical protein
MSIELENPETVLGKVDAAWNYVEQIRLALNIGDTAHAMTCVSNAAILLSVAVEQLEKEESE